MFKTLSIFLGVTICAFLLIILFTRTSHINFNLPTSLPSPTSLPTEEQLSKTLTTIIGDVSILRNEKETVVATGSASKIFEKDVVKTGAEGIAVVDYGEGTLVRLGPSTDVEISASSGAQNKLFQLFGSLYVRFKKLVGIRESFSVETPTTIATVRGTAFASMFDKVTKESLLSVTESKVKVQEKDEKGKVASGSGETVSKDETVSRLSGEKIKRIKEITNKRFKEWLEFNKEADKKLKDDSVEKLASLSARFNSFRIPTEIPVPTKIPVPILNEMPGSGYNRGVVKTDKGEFVLACFGGSRSSIRVVTDAGNEDDCKNDCNVLPLSDFVSRNGGVAGMNGMYFCPADYPACADKKNSFDTLFFHSKAKKYLNNDNNVYSVVPFFATDGGGNPHFLSRSLEQPRDSGYESGIAGNPLMVQGGNVVVPDNLEAKQQIRSHKGAIVQKGDMLYLCVTEGASVPEAAGLYKILGVDNALNVDGGGSAALFVNGSYKYGPGRPLPNAIVFVNR